MDILQQQNVQKRQNLFDVIAFSNELDPKF